MSTQVDALVKFIKGERKVLGLPNHIIGMTTEGGETVQYIEPTITDTPFQGLFLIVLKNGMKY